MWRALLNKINTWLGRPYMSTIISYKRDGSIAIDAVFNNNFVEDLDHNYQQVGSTEYNPLLTERVKLAYYLSDSMSGVVEDYLGKKLQDDDEEGAYPGDMPDDEQGRDVPELAGNGVRQVVDISKMQRTGRQVR